ncbi:MAG: outer membrane beta-barrel protein [Rhizobacter sp.]
MTMKLALVAAVLTMAGQAAQAWEVRPVVGLGLTYGGDTLVDVHYTNGDSTKVRAGGLIAFNGGIEVRFSDLVSMQGLIGYHVDSASADNGDIRFERFPIEVLGHFRLTDWLRIGGGGRYTQAKFRASGEALNYVQNTDFQQTVGAVVEAEFFPYKTIGIKARYVSEKFKPKRGGGPAVNGNHAGIYINYYFY